MGKKLFKRYSIKKKLREIGGCIHVFQAHQAGLDRDVELRLLLRPADHDAAAFKNFKRQFKALAKLDHPSIVKVLDIGYTRTRIFYTTEFRNSVSLKLLLERIGGPMTRQEVIEVALAIGGALKHIHDNDLLHRNIALDTVFYDLDNKRPYISDFALLKDLQEASLPAGPAREAFCFIPTPEFYDDTPFDRRTDLFMLGALLYQLACNKSPFPARERLARMAPDEIFDVIKPSAVHPAVPRLLDSLLMKLLERSPDARFQDADAFLEALNRKRGLMDAHSLINQQRKALLTELKSEIDIQAAASPKSGNQDEPAPLVFLRNVIYDLVEAVGVMPIAIVAALFLVGASLAWLVFIEDDYRRGPGRFSGMAGLSTAAPSRSAMEKRESIIKTVALLQLRPLDPDDFDTKWQSLKDYLFTLPPRKRNKICPYGRLLAIKLEFQEDRERACEKLRKAYFDCDDYIKSADS